MHACMTSVQDGIKDAVLLNNVPSAESLMKNFVLGPTISKTQNFSLSGIPG